MHEQRHYQQKFALFVIDMIAFFAALRFAIFLRYESGLPFAKGGSAPWQAISEAFPFVAVVWLVVSLAGGGYRIRQSALDELTAVLRASALTFGALLAATFFYRGFSYSRGMMVFLIPSFVLTVSLVRIAFRLLRRRVLHRFAGRSRVAILGHNAIAQELIRALRQESEYYELVGVLDTPNTRSTNVEIEAPILGHFEQLDSICQDHDLRMLILVDRYLSDEQVLSTIEICMRHQVTWNMVPAVHELLLDRARVEVVDGIPMVGMRRSNITGFNWFVKRSFDVVASTFLLVLAAPLMFAVALAIALSSRGPIFYVQQRVGYRGQVFPFFKFRSMHVGNSDAIHREYTKKWITENQAHEASGAKAIHKIARDPRVFPVGQFIRKYSVDELPQLLNVLRGEMSLIGPRPALPYEVEVYREWHRRRFEAPPGITGLWQVSGRNRLSFEEMVKLDIEYLENWSLLRDLHILWQTIRVVLFEHAY